MKVNFICLVFLFFITAKPCLSQNRKIDSLKTLLAAVKHDTAKAHLLNDISGRCWRIGQSGEALRYAEQAKALAEQLVAQGRGQVLKTSNRELASSYNNFAIAFWQQGNYILALDYNFKSLKIYEALVEKHGIAAALNNIGLIYDSQKNNEKALDYYIRSAVLMQEYGDMAGVANAYNNIAGIYLNMNKTDQALEYYYKSLAIKEKGKNKISIASSLNNIGSVYDAQGEHTKARELYSKALRMNEEAGNEAGVTVCYINLGNAATKMHAYPMAHDYFTKALKLSLALGSKDFIKESYGNLSTLDSVMGNWKQAYFHHLLAIAYRDSLLSEENTANTVRLQMNYEFDKKEHAAKLEQEKKDAIVNQEKRSQKIVILAVSVGLVLVMILALVIFRSLLLNKKQNRIITAQKELVENQKISLEHKQKEILDSIKYARRIQSALIPTDKMIAKIMGNSKNKS
jgi:tetratricopeptide (TPR) repeat protein